MLIALGSGGVKANATSLVGSLYDEHDDRRDAGFSLFYMGINIGALLGPLLTGLLQKNAGFHCGFGLAAVGMAIGLVQYAARPQARCPRRPTRCRNPLQRSGALVYVVGARGRAVAGRACWSLAGRDHRRNGWPTWCSASPASPRSPTSW